MCCRLRYRREHVRQCFVFSADPRTKRLRVHVHHAGYDIGYGKRNIHDQRQHHDDDDRRERGEHPVFAPSALRLVVLEREQLPRVSQQLLMRIAATIVVCVAIVGGLVAMSVGSSPTDDSGEAPSSEDSPDRPRRWRSSPVETASRATFERSETPLAESAPVALPSDDPVVAQIDALTTRLNEEPADHSAGLALRGQLEERVAALPLEVEEVGCGTSVCRVVLRADESELNPAEVLSGLVNGPPFTDGPGGSVTFPGEATNDLSVAIVHLVRPGHSLPN